MVTKRKSTFALQTLRAEKLMIARSVWSAKVLFRFVNMGFDAKIRPKTFRGIRFNVYKKSEAIMKRYHDSYLATECISKGRQYYINGQYEQAKHEFSRVVALDPNYATAYVELGKAKHALGQYKEAKNDYNHI